MSTSWRIEDSLNYYYENHYDGEVDYLLRIFGERGKFGLKHFDMGRNYLIGLSNAFKEIVFNTGLQEIGKTLSDKDLGQVIVYMSPGKGDSIYPTSYLFGMSKTGIASFSRRFPMEVKSDHVEERYQTRNRELFLYDSLEFREAISMGLVLCKTFQDRFDFKGGDRIPVMLPMSNGLFIGNMEEPEPKNQFDIFESYFMSTDFRFSPPQKLRSAYWLLNNKIVVRTFYNGRTLNKDQKAITSMFSDFSSNNFLAEKKDNMVSDYMRGGALSKFQPDYARDRDILVDEMFKIISSDEWIAESERIRENQSYLSFK